jgi:chromosome partitioning protein
LSLLTVNALCASDGVIIPMQCEFFAIRGIQVLIDSINRTRDRLNPDLELLGILATMYSTGTIHSREVMDEIRSLYGERVFDIIIYKSIRFAEASVANRAIVEYSRKHKGARAYTKLAKIIVDREINELAY